MENMFGNPLAAEFALNLAVEITAIFLGFVFAAIGSIIIKFVYDKNKYGNWKVIIRVSEEEFDTIYLTVEDAKILISSPNTKGLSALKTLLGTYARVKTRKLSEFRTINFASKRIEVNDPFEEEKE